MDKKDEKIIEILKDHAEYTTRQIAKKTLLPITTVHNRIRKLRREGIIKKYTIKLDNSKLGKNFVSYVLISVNLPILKQKHKTQVDLANELKKFYFIDGGELKRAAGDFARIDGRVVHSAFVHHLVGDELVFHIEKKHAELLARRMRHGEAAIVRELRPGADNGALFEFALAGAFEERLGGLEIGSDGGSGAFHFGDALGRRGENGRKRAEFREQCFG